MIAIRVCRLHVRSFGIAVEPAIARRLERSPNFKYFGLIAKATSRVGIVVVVVGYYQAIR